MLRVQIHASLFDYLDRLQREAQGERVSRIPVSCHGRVALLTPTQLREQLIDIPVGMSWEFCASVAAHAA